MSDNRMISVESLTHFLFELYAATGMNPEDAQYCAEAMVQTNLWGIDSHGVLRAPIYLQRLRRQVVNPHPKVTRVSGGQAMILLDGDGGLGYIAGREAMLQAIDLARRFHISAVGVRNSNHFGAAGLYAAMAAAQGMIGLVVTNVGPNMVAPGGSRPITGNNPLAVAIPTFGDFPLLLDISLSNAAGGKLLLASKKGEKIPLDWATDRNGRPTDDPDAAFAGFLLPVGGHKGLGLSYVIDILSGLITGGGFQFDVKSMYTYPDDPSQTGHFMIVINPDIWLSRDDLQHRMAAYCQTIKSSPMWDSEREMMLPGEIEYRTEQQRRKSGIPVPEHLYQELLTLAGELGTAAALENLTG